MLYFLVLKLTVIDEEVNYCASTGRSREILFFFVVAWKFFSALFSIVTLSIKALHSIALFERQSHQYICAILKPGEDDDVAAAIFFKKCVGFL